MSSPNHISSIYLQVGLRPKPAHRRPMTLPLCRGNHWAGVVRVTSITQFRARQFSSPYTVYRLPSPALAQVCRYCRYFVDIVDNVRYLC